MSEEITVAADVEGVPEPESEVKRKKPVRRVRVIEVIDEDEELDLDEVLATAGLAKELDEGPDEEPQAEPPARTPKAAKAAKATKAAAVPRAAKTPAPAEAEPKVPEARKSVSIRIPSFAAVRSNGLVVAVVAVLVAGVATFAIYQWRQAAELQSAKSDRAKVAARVTQFGNVVMSYDLSNISGSAAQIKPYLTGDALNDFQNTLTQLQQNAAKTTVSAAFKSKTDNVYVKDVNGRLASAVLVWTLSVSQGGSTQPLQSNLGLTIDLVKDNGVWKIAKYTGIAQLNLSGSTSGASPSPTTGK